METKTRQKIIFFTQQCSLGQTEWATCCTPSPSWPFPRPCPWSSHSHPYTWGSTTCPWAYDGAQHRRNETTRWDIHRCRSQSSRRRTPAHTGSTSAHPDRWAGLGVTLLSQTFLLTFSSSLKRFWPSFPGTRRLPLPRRDPDPRNFPDFLHFSGVSSVSPQPCLHHRSPGWPRRASCRGGQFCLEWWWLMMTTSWMLQWLSWMSPWERGSLGLLERKGEVLNASLFVVFGSQPTPPETKKVHILLQSSACASG